jgi:hypothetical protein
VRTLSIGDVVGEIAVFASPPDPSAPPEVAEGGLRTASVVATSPMRLIGLFKRERRSRLGAYEQYSTSISPKTLSARWPSSGHKASRESLRAPIRSPAAPKQRRFRRSLPGASRGTYASQKAGSGGNSAVAPVFHARERSHPGSGLAAPYRCFAR